MKEPCGKLPAQANEVLRACAGRASLSVEGAAVQKQAHVAAMACVQDAFTAMREAGRGDCWTAQRRLADAARGARASNKGLRAAGWKRVR